MRIESTRPATFVQRYRLYIDESGDHVYRMMATSQHRFLCLLGCWFHNPDYVEFHQALEAFKTKHLPNHPDRPVVLHREDIINARGPFKTLQETTVREAFNSELLDVIAHARFTIVAVVIDKFELWNSYGDAAQHPYHLGLRFLLQRYVGYLNHINRTGDVMAESRGRVEDRLLAETYTTTFNNGALVMPAHMFQSALSSRELKLKRKTENISGLQLADLLGHPVKQWVLKRYGLISDDLAPFATQLMDVVLSKLNRHLYRGTVDGYGAVLYPQK